MKLGENWELHYQETFNRGSGWPVDPIYIPALLSSQIVRVSCLSKTARSSWRAAGELIQIVGDYRNPDFEGESTSIPLNVMKLVEFTGTVESYSLKFYPKAWIDSFELKIESPSV
jgi:hypothetical protein